MESYRQLLIKKLQHTSLPIVDKPFLALSKKIGISSEAALISEIKKYIKLGLIRKFGAFINHYKLGYTANVLVAWRLPEDKIEEVANLLSWYTQVSHCYLRDTSAAIPNWDYNLYAMVHGKNRAECLRIVKAVAKQAKIRAYKLLWTVKRYKHSRHE